MQALAINAAQTQLVDSQIQASKSGLMDKAAAREAAEQFEAVFISQMLAPMFESVPTDGIMGGGEAEGMYRSLMVNEYGKSIVKSGGIGIADNLYREILKYQEG